MSIRLNKALRELNIGLQTAVEFLEKRTELGEVKPEPSFKLNDDQYNALVNAFKQDAEVRNQAEKLFQKKTKEKKSVQTSDNRAESLLGSSTQQQFKPLGKIDLDQVGKKKPEVAKSVAVEKAPVSEKPTTAVSPRSEERRAGKECRSRWSPYH